jgi:AP-4 complex subunit beta-1
MSRPESRKGEVNELRGMLKNPKVPAKTSVEKVIAYMTLGIDVSPLFTEMLMMTHTKDLIQKKMVYLYLCSYADLNPELAVLAINTLQRDCQEDDPLIRGLALRSLCGLRVKNLVEYIVTPIRKCLADNSAYVRKVAVVGVAKLFSVDPAAVKSSDFVDQLFNKLNDRDNEVVINAVFALNEILADEGGMPMNKKIIYHLVNKLHEFHEWGQCAVLELLARYETASQEEMFDMMNLLEDRLKHANSAVVLAATKVFLNFTRNMEKLHIEVYQRLKAPLLTLIGGNNVEICFAVLTHVSLLVKRCNGIFNDQFRNFFIRYNDPLWVKSLKIEILGEISDSDNATEIIAELSEYITNVDVEIASTAIHALGKISVNVESHSSSAIEHLLSFLDLGIDYVNTATCIAMKDILRRYPDRYEEILPGLHKVLKSVEDPEGKVAAIWILGEYGDLIGDAPYIVEPLIENFNHESSSSVKLEILTTTMKLFFKRPPEVHKMLGALLSTVISDCTDVDVRDRALLLYRLLKYDVHEVMIFYHLS